MENKCFSCEISLYNDENKAPFVATKNLMIFCIPEISEIVYNEVSFVFCLNCHQVLKGYANLRRKYFQWQEALQKAELFCEVNVKEEETNTEIEEQQTETGTENVVQTEIIEEDEEDMSEEKERKHETVEIKVSTNSCPVCKITLKNKYLVNRHIKTVHTSGKQFECQICNQKFGAKVYLRAHEKTHDELRPYMCQFCGKSYKSTSDLSHHELIHANRRAYKCPEGECNKAFNTSSELNKHKLIAHTARTAWKYQCDYCGRKFPMKCTLDRHVKSHTNDRSFQCHFCEYKGFTNTELRKHLAKHDDIRAHKCFMCSAEYKRKATLEVHLLQKHQIGDGDDADLPIKLTEKNFVCQFCGKRYTNSTRLRTHIRSNHADVEIDVNV